MSLHDSTAVPTTHTLTTGAYPSWCLDHDVTTPGFAHPRREDPAVFAVINHASDSHGTVAWFAREDVLNLTDDHGPMRSTVR